MSLSYREIADLLGCSHGTVINIERRALAKMAAAAAALGLRASDLVDAPERPIPQAAREHRPNSDDQRARRRAAYTKHYSAKGVTRCGQCGHQGHNARRCTLPSNTNTKESK